MELYEIAWFCLPVELAQIIFDLKILKISMLKLYICMPVLAYQKLVIL